MVSKWNADNTQGDEETIPRYHNYQRGSCDNPHTCIPLPPVLEWPPPVWSHGHQWHASDGPAPLDGYGLAEVGIRLNRIDHVHGTEVTNLCNILTDCDRGYTSYLLLLFWPCQQGIELNTVLMYHYIWLSSSGNHTPGSRSYSDLVDTWADSVCIHQPTLKLEFKGHLCSADGSLWLVLILHSSSQVTLRIGYTSLFTG